MFHHSSEKSFYVELDIIFIENALFNNYYTAVKKNLGALVFLNLLLNEIYTLWKGKNKNLF